MSTPQFSSNEPDSNDSQWKLLAKLLNATNESPEEISDIDGLQDALDAKEPTITVLEEARGGTGGTSIATSPSLFTVLNGNQRLFAHVDDFDADAATYIAATGLTGEPAFVVDDAVRMLKGSPSSASLRGSVWTTLSANRWTNAKGIYLFQSAFNHGAGTAVEDLRGTMNLTIAGGMAWNAAGFTFDGTNDQLDGTGAHITSGQWSLLGVGSSTTASKTIAGQNSSSANFRTSFATIGASGTWSSFKRVDPTSYSHSSGVSAATLNSFLQIQDATHLRSFIGGSETEAASTALAATTIENNTFIIGDVASGSSNFNGLLKLVMLFGEDVSTDYAELHANLNSLLGLGL